MPLAPFATNHRKWIHKVPVCGNMPRFRMLGTHHGFNILSLPLMGIYEDEVLTRMNLVMETLQFLVLVINAKQAALPGPVKSRDKK